MIMVCCLFGHRDASADIMPLLTSVLEQLIVSEGARLFYVGEQGAFDRMAISVLTQLKRKYRHISFCIVLPYVPLYMPASTDETILPEGIEKVHPHYAIPWRNRWLVKNSAVVVAYVKRGIGGAAKAVEYAGKLKKKVINLADYPSSYDSTEI